MAAEKLDWFPCNPAKLLGALAGMRAPEGYVYTIVLLRIYEDGGECRDTLDALVTRTKLNKRVVSDALDSLFRAGRLTRTGNGITNPVASDVIAESHALREKRKIASVKAGIASGKKRKENQQTDPTIRSSDVERPSTPLQVQDTLFPDGNKALKPMSALELARKELFERGKQVLGENAGGVVQRLLAVKHGQIPLARAAIEQASTMDDPRQYVGGILKAGGSNGKSGFSSLGARLRQKVAEDGIDAAGGEPHN